LEGVFGDYYLTKINKIPIEKQLRFKFYHGNIPSLNLENIQVLSIFSKIKIT